MSGSPHVFRLYVAGNAPNSASARANLAAIIRERIDGDCTLEEVDVLREPLRALADGVIVTPTLLLLEPGPPRRVVGNLSQREKVLEILGL